MLRLMNLFQADVTVSWKLVQWLFILLKIDMLNYLCKAIHVKISNVCCSE